ncbi:MAG: ABC transporter permease [Prevotella sp.]|jgi:lipoprotein-releasing system permease protein
MNFPLFIARRIHASEQGERKVSKPAVVIATAGVAVGLAVMIVSVCVVLGFKNTIRNKVIGFGSHIQIANFMTQISSEATPVTVNDSMMRVIKAAPGVKHVERFAYKQGILKTDEDFLGVVFQGVGPDYDTTFISKHLIAGSMPKFSDEVSTNKILVSNMMAKTLRLKIGQRLFAYFIDENGVRMRRFTVQGIYETNLTQFDQSICFTDLYTAVKLNGWEANQVSGIGVKVKDFNRLLETEDYYIDKVNRTKDPKGETFSSATIRDLYPQIFSWLGLLDLNVWVIIALMTCVAAVTMISGLLIIILERTSMIGLFKALGAHNATIRHIFLWLSVFIIGRGMLIGNVVGLGLVFLQKWTHLVKLNAETYYVSYAPVEVSIPLILLINAGTLAICLFALIAPSYLVSHIHPAKSIRYE